MCGLAGFITSCDFSETALSTLCHNLAEQSMQRGTDAAGLSFVQDNLLQIHKEPRRADEISFVVPENTRAGMIHTRMATVGDSNKNFNNHPFAGQTLNGNRFTLAHNGVIHNAKELREQYKLPKTEIETDSYVAVQLLNQEKEISFDTLAKMAEAVQGSFVFTVLEEDNTFWIIREDNPLYVLFLQHKSVIIYSSTEDILFSSLVGTEFFSEIQKAIDGDRDAVIKIPIKSGEILTTLPDLSKEFGSFHYTPHSFDSHYSDLERYHSRLPFFGQSHNKRADESNRIEVLKTIAHSFGYSSGDVDELLSDGFTIDEIESELFE